MRAKISVAIITFNEETNIRRTLDSVKWVDEIVVVDSGSTDRTVAICQGIYGQYHPTGMAWFRRSKKFSDSQDHGRLGVEP